MGLGDLEDVSVIGRSAGLLGKAGTVRGGRVERGFGGDTEEPFILAKRSLRTCSFCSHVMSDTDTLSPSSPTLSLHEN